MPAQQCIIPNSLTCTSKECSLAPRTSLPSSCFLVMTLVPTKRFLLSPLLWVIRSSPYARHLHLSWYEFIVASRTAQRFERRELGCYCLCHLWTGRLDGGWRNLYLNTREYKYVIKPASPPPNDRYAQCLLPDRLSCSQKNNIYWIYLSIHVLHSKADSSFVLHHIELYLQSLRYRRSFIFVLSASIKMTKIVYKYRYVVALLSLPAAPSGCLSVV